jgi:uncharacterized protein YndB with AHSA1/START domain
MALDVVQAVEVERTPQVVFEFLSDAENMPRWMDHFVMVEQASEGPPELGTTYRYKMKTGSGEESTFEWSEFEPGRTLAWHGERVKGTRGGTIEPNGRWELQPAGEGGTLLRGRMQPELGGTMKLLAPFMRRRIKKGSKRDFQKLKEMLESSRADAPAPEAQGEPEAPGQAAGA